jgi:hypothetical protein
MKMLMRLRNEKGAREYQLIITSVRPVLYCFFFLKCFGIVLLLGFKKNSNIINGRKGLSYLIRSSYSFVFTCIRMAVLLFS